MGLRQSLDNRTQSLEVDTRSSHLERDLWRPSREEAYLSHIWWRRSRGQYCNIGPRRRASLHKSSPCSRQITTPASHRSVFYRPGALPATQPTASKHWRHIAAVTYWIIVAHTRSSLYFTVVWEILQKLALSTGGSGLPLNTWFLGPTWVLP